MVAPATLTQIHLSILEHQYPELEDCDRDAIASRIAAVFMQARAAGVAQWWAFYVTDDAIDAYLSICTIPQHTLRANTKALMCLFAELLVTPESEVAPPSSIVQRCGAEFAIGYVYLADMFVRDMRRKWYVRLCRRMVPSIADRVISRKAFRAAERWCASSDGLDQYETLARSLIETFGVCASYACRLAIFVAAQRYRRLGRSISDALSLPISPAEMTVVFDELIAASQTAYVKTPIV